MDSRKESTVEQNVERVLEEQGRSIAWLSRKAGVSVSYAWMMLRGQRPLTDEFKAKAAEALGVPADMLFDPAKAS